MTAAPKPPLKKSQKIVLALLLGFCLLGVTRFALQIATDTALITACETGNDSLARVSLSLGADPNAKEDPETQYTALMVAIQSGHIDLVGLLLRHGADPNRESEAGATALQLATSSNDPDVIAALKKAGASH